MQALAQLVGLLGQTPPHTHDTEINPKEGCLLQSHCSTSTPRPPPASCSHATAANTPHKQGSNPACHINCAAQLATYANPPAACCQTPVCDVMHVEAPPRQPAKMLKKFHLNCWASGWRTRAAKVIHSAQGAEPGSAQRVRLPAQQNSICKVEQRHKAQHTTGSWSVSRSHHPSNKEQELRLCARAALLLGQATTASDSLQQEPPAITAVGSLVDNVIVQCTAKCCAACSWYQHRAQPRWPMLARVAARGSGPHVA